ncbi:hypothetical protein FRX31_026359 [Thalictrum thalictroides]|uniref:Uncharacterized protein n=1 Tax=Thalictrum thalictroides TaxID=46969 RepID=A0A7J6VGM7_THATH|nr:hypothetical protein FRX31_026359 [Thalictrum thalictroides]
MQPLIAAGIKWKIGNGRDINLWSDSWIPGHHVSTNPWPQPLNCSLVHVADIIDHTYMLLILLITLYTFGSMILYFNGGHQT